MPMLISLLADDLTPLGTIRAHRVPVGGDRIQFNGAWWVVKAAYFFEDGSAGVTFEPSAD